MTVTLAEWLGTRSRAQLATILTARPDATLPPAPRHLLDLAERLEISHSIAQAMHALPTPAIQVVEVLQLLGPGAGERATLAGWLGCEADDPALTGALELLASRALAWPDGDMLHMPQRLYGAFRYPLGLGPPASALLERYPVEHLRSVAHTLDLPARGRKPELITTIATRFGDSDWVRALVAGADQASRDRLYRMAVEGPAAVEHLAAWYGYQQPDAGLRWGIERGLVLLDNWGVPQLPREAAVALRGPDWHAPFTPQPPGPALAEISDEAVERETAAAASTAVEQLTALLETVAAAPVSLLKAGGLGVKELRRLAKALGIEEGTVRLWLELAYEAQLVGLLHHRSAPTQLLPTRSYDEWVTSEPADRLAALLPVWRDLPAGLLPAPTGDGKPTPALLRDHDGLIAATVRHHLLRFASDLPAGRGVAAPAGAPAAPGSRTAARSDPSAGVAAAVGWLAPLSIGRYRGLDALVAAAWREAQLVGVIAHGTLSSLGRALLIDQPAHSPPDGSAADRGGADQLAAACRKLLPPATGEALFQADLTAVVPGTPTRSLAELLDAAADRESRGGAFTWRFSPGSVRRALDAGHEPDDLLAALRVHAVGGALPQPLEYLVGDLARRHGAVRVREVACVLRADDPALVAEIAGARALRSLQLTMIAPTVLGSAEPVTETLAALRAAGYAPVGESADGAPQLERTEQRRAGLPSQSHRRATGFEPAPEPVRPAEPQELAGRLLAAPRPGPEVSEPAQPALSGLTDLTEPPEPPEFVIPEPGEGYEGYEESPAYEYEEVDLTAELAVIADHLAPGERRLLAHAIETAGPVTIGYTNAQGNRSTRVIDSAELDGGHLIAWCHLRDDERMFAVHRIDSVAPAV